MLVRLEMGEERMSTAVAAVPYLAVGILLGIVYFGAIRLSARLIAANGRVTTALALTVGRFIVLGALLALASLQGTLPLLATALGIAVGRVLVMRKTARAEA